MTIKEKITEIAKRCNDDDMLEIIASDLESFGNYVNVVYMMEYNIPILRARYEGEGLRDKIMAQDERRHSAHERAIVGVKRLNRFSEKLGLPAFFPGNTEDRYAVADFCGTVVKRLFDGRVGNTQVELAELKNASVSH